MAKNPISLHLTDTRKTRLDALVNHSEYEGHGAQSEFLRDLIDEAAAEHPDIDFDHPDPIPEKDNSQYHPGLYDGMLNEEDIREILNSYKAPAINPEHCPPLWEPRDKSAKAILMASYYRYYKYIEYYGIDDKNEKEFRQSSIEDVVGILDNDKKKNEYKHRLKKVIAKYGEEPSNVVIVNDTPVRVWIDNMTTIVDAETNIVEDYISTGEEIINELRSRDEEKLLSETQEIVEKLNRKV